MVFVFKVLIISKILDLGWPEDQAVFVPTNHELWSQELVWTKFLDCLIEIVCTVQSKFHNQENSTSQMKF